VGVYVSSRSSAFHGSYALLQWLCEYVGLGESPMSQVQCRVLIAGCEENPGSDTWLHSWGWASLCAYLVVGFVCCCLLFCPNANPQASSRFQIKIWCSLGKPGELDSILPGELDSCWGKSQELVYCMDQGNYLECPMTGTDACSLHYSLDWGTRLNLKIENWRALWYRPHVDGGRAWKMLPFSLSKGKG